MKKLVLSFLVSISAGDVTKIIVIKTQNYEIKLIPITKIKAMYQVQKPANLISKVLSFAFIIVFFGCATTAPPNSGFLEDYSRLHEDKYGDRSLQWWEKENFNWQQYQKIMFDPVVLYYHPEAKHQQINPDAVKKLTDYFREVVDEELADEYPIVTTPGPDVLRVRAAITEIVPANPAINYPAMAAVLIPLDMGGAAIETAFLDSETDEVLATMVDKKMGSPVKPRGFTKMGYARAAFEEWAKELKRALKTNP